MPNKSGLSLRWLGPGLVLALAAYTRLSHLDLVEFKHDEAVISNLAAMIADGRSFPLVGNYSSVGVPNGAAFVYLMAVPYVFTRDPVLATGFIGLLGVLAVFLCWHLVRRHFGESAALLAGLLFAVSPWAVMYSRKIWEPAVMPLFSLLLMTALYRYAAQGQSWQLPLAMLWGTLLPQIHLSGAVFLPVVFIVLLTWRGSFRWHPFFAGLVLALLSLFPYAQYEADNGWRDLCALFQLGGRPATLDISVATWFIEMAGGPIFKAHGVFSFDWLYGLERGLLILAAVYVLGRAIHEVRAGPPGRERKFVLLNIWLIVPLLVAGYSPNAVQPHYLNALFPVQFVVIAVFLADLVTHLLPSLAAKTAMCPAGPRGFGVVATTVAMLIGAFVLSQLYHFSALFTDSVIAQVVESGFAGGDYGIPLRYTLGAIQAAQTINTSSATGPIYLATREKDFPTGLSFTRRELALKPFDGRTTLVFPGDLQGESVLVTTDDRSHAAQVLRRIAPNAEVCRVEYSGALFTSRLYRVTPSTATNLAGTLSLQPLPFRIGGSVTLLGWDAPRVARAGDGLSITMAWRVDCVPEPSPGGYSCFWHIVDTRNKSWGGVDDLGYSTSSWSAGETVATWQKLMVSPEAPLGQYWIEFGIYKRQGVLRLPISDYSGRPAGDTLRIGPIKVIPSAGLASAANARPESRQSALLEDKVELLGYDMWKRTARPGESVSVILHWLARGPRGDYTVFVHLVTEDGRLVAQVDCPPRSGTYPTSAWEENEYVRDEYQLELPATIGPGTYRLVVGMYEPQSGQRIKVIAPDGNVVGDSVSLGTTLSIE